MSVHQEHAQQQYLAEKLLARQRRWAELSARMVARNARQVLLQTLLLGPVLFGLFTLLNVLMSQENPGLINFAASFICALMLVLAIRHSAKLNQNINKKNH